MSYVQYTPCAGRPAREACGGVRPGSDSAVAQAAAAADHSPPRRTPTSPMEDLYQLQHGFAGLSERSGSELARRASAAHTGPHAAAAADGRVQLADSVDLPHPPLLE